MTDFDYLQVKFPLIHQNGIYGSIQNYLVTISYLFPQSVF